MISDALSPCYPVTFSSLMNNKPMLMIPGPTPVPEKVLGAIAQQPISHRSSEYNQLSAEITAGLKWLHQTENDVLPLTVSGTGATEAGIINFLSPGDGVLVGCNGKFGDRWVDLCEIFGLQVTKVAAEWGQPLDPEEFRVCLEKDPKIKAVIVTHSETSTGVLNDLETIAKYVKEVGDSLVIVDAVTSLGTCNLPVDEWGLDVVVSGSQKGYMIPPGLGLVSVSPKAWAAYKLAKFPRFYLDLGKYRDFAAQDSSPFTPPVNLMFGLRVALEMMQAEGLENIFRRHQRLGKATREAIKALGLTLFAKETAASPAVTAISPHPVESEAIRGLLKKRFNIELAGGQNHLKGKIFRIGHLGFAGDRDILTVIAALEAVLPELGKEITPGAGIAAASDVFNS